MSKALGVLAENLIRRVSSEMQIETGHSLDAQRTFISEFARVKG